MSKLLIATAPTSSPSSTSSQLLKLRAAAHSNENNTSTMIVRRLCSDPESLRSRSADLLMRRTFRIFRAKGGISKNARVRDVPYATLLPWLARG